MKVIFLKFFPLLASIWLAFFIAAPRAFPQTPVNLNIQLYAGLSVTGAVGSVYAIQYTTNVSQTNAWLTLTNVTVLSSPFLWVDSTVPATALRFYRAMFIQPAPTNMVWIPPGTFTMGSPTDEVGRETDEIQHSVTLTKGFYIGKFLVTQADYLGVIGYNPSHFTNDLMRPVESLTWYEATNYCSLLTQQEKAAGRLPTGWAYLLPTEAEWEYACRAGTTTPFSYGYDPTYIRLEFYAWFSANSSSSTHPVGTKLPNPWGLYDMHGNLLEWCSDWYAPYNTSNTTDPTGPTSGVNRLVRGGVFNSTAATCRSAVRGQIAPWGFGYGWGFRVVLASSSP